MSMVGFPLLLIPLAIYNIIVFLMPDVSLAAPLVTLPLMSGASWQLTLSDVLLALGVLMLMFEVIKGARPGAKYLTDHLLSLIILGGAIAEFLLWPRFGNSTFFLLTLLALADFLSGVALRTRRGAVATVAASRTSRRAVVEPETPHDTVDHPAMPSVASVQAAKVEPKVESRIEPRVEHPEPTFAAPETPTPHVAPAPEGTAGTDPTSRPPETR